MQQLSWHRCGWIVLILLQSTLFSRADDFPAELVNFQPYQGNPVFTAEGEGHWDVKIRERGWILRDDDGFRLWFTGYDGTRDGVKKLGYAHSQDGIHWVRDPNNPIYDEHWVEDMMVVRDEDAFYMFAEGLHDQAQLLTSKDGTHWDRVGTLDIRKSDGSPIGPGPFGTPTAWKEEGVWKLMYERMDAGVWLATSRDGKTWTNVQDEPVLRPGPSDYDGAMIAVNQVIRHEGRYYTYYHGRGSDSPNWCTCIAVSDDLRTWKKYPQNPILPREKNVSSGIVVFDGKRLRLYTMHDRVDLYFPASQDD